MKQQKATYLIAIVAVLVISGTTMAAPITAATQLVPDAKLDGGHSEVYFGYLTPLSHPADNYIVLPYVFTNGVKTYIGTGQVSSPQSWSWWGYINQNDASHVGLLLGQTVPSVGGGVDVIADTLGNGYGDLTGGVWTLGSDDIVYADCTVPYMTAFNPAGSGDIAVGLVPEPGAVGLLSLGLGGLVFFRLRHGQLSRRFGH